MISPIHKPMKKNSAHHAPQQGITLIEILVVVFLMGILSATAVISYSPPPFAKEREAIQTLLKDVSTIQERALLESEVRGLLFFTDRYLILQIDQAKNTWVATGAEREIDLSNANLLADDELATIAVFDLTETVYPQVVFSPSAQMTPFKLSITINSDEGYRVFEIESDILGRAAMREYE